MPVYLDEPAEPAKGQTEEATENESGIVTTQEEIEGFLLLSTIKPLCRMHFNSVSVKYIIRMKRSLATLCLVACIAFSSPAARAQASDATEAVREAINDLLDDFDGFKDSEIFRRCVYGCGSENPGSEWRDRIKTLQRQAMRREDIPTRLKDAIGELWQMGRTYARGNARKAAELRRRIEAVLEE